MKFLAPYESHAYALMRIVAGFLLLWHGSAKLFAIPLASGATGYVKYVAGPIELVGGTLVMIGLFTRPAAFIASGLCAAAYWIAHGTHSFLPYVNKGELAALYAFVFLYIAVKGAGIWSLDRSRAAD
ncbi:MAG: DoxX family protein [Arenicellales bacterium]